MGAAKDRWEKLEPRTQALIAVVTLISTIATSLAGVVAYFERRFHEVSKDKASGCLTIPATGQHYIDSGKPGDVATVHWKNIIRHRGDCGKPLVTAKLVNGGRISHEPELSIGTGIQLPIGQQDLSYNFNIPSNAKPGLASFQIWVSFPDAVGGSRTVMSPPIPFIIEETDEP